MHAMDLQRDRVIQVAEFPAIGLQNYSLTGAVVAVTAGHLIGEEADLSAAGSRGLGFWL